MAQRRIRRTVSVTDGVTFVEGPASNWIVVTSTDGIDLIDAGYPADVPLVIESLETAGASLADLRRIWVTHAHTDHIGGIPGLLEHAPHASVLAGSADVGPTRGVDREQVTVGKLGLRLLSPRWFRWAAGAARSGGLQPIAIPTVRAFTDDDFAHTRLEPMQAAGHTAGSTAYLLDGGSVLVAGDVVITDHPTLRRRRPRPQIIDPVFSHAPEDTRQAAAALLQSGATVVLPGHGPAMIRRGEEWMQL